MISKELDSSRELTQWSLRCSFGETGIGIILWLQHQPCGEVDIILHPCGLRAFKCRMIITANRIIKANRIAPWISRRMLVIQHTLPAEGILPSSPNIEDGRSLHTWEIGDTRENVLNDVIVLHKLGHCDLFYYISLTNVLHNIHNQS